MSMVESEFHLLLVCPRYNDRLAISEKQLSVFGSRRGQICPLMHVLLCSVLHIDWQACDAACLLFDVYLLVPFHSMTKDLRYIRNVLVTKFIRNSNVAEFNN